jgi:hypothetical protein
MDPAPPGAAPDQMEVGALENRASALGRSKAGFGGAGLAGAAAEAEVGVEVEAAGPGAGAAEGAAGGGLVERTFFTDPLSRFTSLSLSLPVPSDEEEEEP